MMNRLEALVVYNLTQTDLDNTHTLIKWAKEYLKLDMDKAEAPCPFCNKEVEVIGHWNGPGYAKYINGQQVEHGILEAIDYDEGDAKCIDGCFLIRFYEHANLHNFVDGDIKGATIPPEVWEDFLLEEDE